MKKKELKSKVLIVTEMTDTSKSQEPTGTTNERPEKLVCQILLCRMVNTSWRVTTARTMRT